MLDGAVLSSTGGAELKGKSGFQPMLNTKYDAQYVTIDTVTVQLELAMFYP
jgi:hypothetical protein